MGADLYRDDYRSGERAQDFKKLEAGVRRTDESAEDKDEWMRLYAKIYSHPYYFRDSYNDSSLFWKIGLSWWGDIPEYVDDDYVLHPEKAGTLLDEVKQRAELLAYNIRDLPDDAGNEHDLDKKYFTQKYNLFIDFLQQAIDGGHAITCSV